MHSSLLRSFQRLGLLKNRQVFTSVDVNGTSFKIPIRNEVGLKNVQMTEPWMSQIMQRLDLSAGLLDVGVNVGQTLLKYKSIYPDSPYTGFEPNPVCIQYANQLVTLNSLKNVLVYPTGISSEPGFVKLNFYSHSSSDPSASIVENYRPDQKVVRTEVIRVSSFKDIQNECDLADRYGAVKIDVEGAEQYVLEGMKDYLAAQRIPILIEILPVYTEDNAPRMESQRNIESLLKELNYVIYRVQKKDGHLEGFERLSELGIHGDLSMCDYVFAPEEMTL